MEEIFEALPYVASSYHYGSRIAFDNKENIYITVGDRFNYTTASEIGDPYLSDPQKLNNHLGKIIRLKLDGSIPEDNPFLAEENAYPEVFTFGHRNPQGIAYNFATMTVNSVGRSENSMDLSDPEACEKSEKL